ncbi:unnamed protein product [Angiostrongylus costaricensis]|uniref:SH3 domain-containing GRB2-like protein n=1 Tax=Angiostrongylus costaricensis TaxID=334426 RepID=A0A0R3PUZ0_ANGCS|nr:unnamed protein product [Angiostrongylus costaricensis]
MADLLNKHIKKATSRTKEKLLEGIGKAKATQDEIFDSHASNLAKQSKACERLYKDIKAYSSALKVLCQAERALHDTIRESYEAEWPNREHLTAILDNTDIQTNELEKALCEDLPQAVSTYVSQFNDLKKKVDKRGRKLVDYDHAKNSYNSVKASSKKGEADPKVAKAFTELKQAEAMYKEINNELLEVLPATYDSRITFYVDTLQALFNSQSLYQTECSELNRQIVTQLDHLGESMDLLRVPRPERPSTPTESVADMGSRKSTPSPAPAPPPATPASLVDSVPGQTTASNPFDEEDVEEAFENKMYPVECNFASYMKKLAATRRGDSEEIKVAREAPVSGRQLQQDAPNPFDEDTDDEEQHLSIPTEVPPTDHALEGVTKEARKVLYLVKSTHEYKALDTDELTFGPGEELKVLETKPEDQVDEGWQLGEKSDGTRGVFPENFTKKIEKCA